MSDSTLSLCGVKHKVIGLVSGGKDSCFNLLHCLANGHDLVAIATLQPASGIGGTISPQNKLELTTESL